MHLRETTAEDAVKQPWSLRRNNPAVIQLQWDPWARSRNCKMRSLCKRKRFKANHNQIPLWDWRNCQADKVQRQWWRIKLLWRNANSVKVSKQNVENSTCSLGFKLKAKCRDPEDLYAAKCRWNSGARYSCRGADAALQHRGKSGTAPGKILYKLLCSRQQLQSTTMALKKSTSQCTLWQEIGPACSFTLGCSFAGLRSQGWKPKDSVTFWKGNALCH